jgi:hypothetical protein
MFLAVLLTLTCTTVYALEGWYPPLHIFFPWLFKKLELSAAQAVFKPQMCGFVEKRKAVEERHTVFWESVGIVWDERVMDAC